MIMFNNVYILQKILVKILFFINLSLKLITRIGILELKPYVLIPNNTKNNTIWRRLTKENAAFMS